MRSKLAKSVVTGDDRAEAIRRERRIRREARIEGVPTTLPFHRRILDEETFVSNRHTTTSMDELE